MSRSLLPACVVVALSAVSLCAQGGRLLFEEYGLGIYGGGGYGVAIVVIGDQDGDTFVDFAVGDVSALQTGSAFGAVEIRSGLDSSLLQAIPAPSSDQAMGRLLAAPGDVDGDQVPDILTASNSAVLLLSGADASLIWRVPTVFPTGLAAPGDWNNDLVPDVAWISGGVVEIVSGVDGSSVTSLGSGVMSVAAVATTDPNTRRLAVQQAAGITMLDSTGATVWTLPGLQRVDAVGDLNGDMFEDVLGSSASSATADVLSGLDGSLLLTIPDGDTASGGVDLNLDGVPDLVVGEFVGNAGGMARAYSGVDGTLLFQRRGQESGEGLGVAVAMHPGFGATTRPCILVGTRDKFNGSQSSGAALGIALAAPGEVDGSFRPFGQSCNFRNTRLRPGRGLPTIGEQYFFRFDNFTQPQGFELMVWGESNQTYNGLALPLPLPSTLSCAQLYVSPDVVLFEGLASFRSVAIPLRSVLIGVQIHVQGISAIGFPTIIHSDAATLTIGN